MRNKKTKRSAGKRSRKSPTPNAAIPSSEPSPVRVEKPRDAAPISGDQYVKELGEAALYLLPGNKMKFENNPHWWDSFLLRARDDPETARMHMVKMDQIVRGGVHSLVEWAATANHLPEVQEWAATCLADVLSWLEEFEFADLPRSPETYGAAFHKRWRYLHPDGRGPSRFAVVQIFAQELLWKSDAILRNILDAYPTCLPEDAPESSKALWNFVDGCVKWQFKEGNNFVDQEIVRLMFLSFRRNAKTEEAIWREHLWPLMQETWPSWIREPGREAFVGFGKVKIGLPLTMAKRKNGKLALEPSQWRDAVRGHIKHMALFENLFHGEDT